MRYRIRNLIYVIEDKFARMSAKYPKSERYDGYPFLSGDSYYFASRHRIRTIEDLMRLNVKTNSPFIFIEVILIQSHWAELISILKRKGFICGNLIIGESDVPPTEAQLIQLNQFFKTVWCVNLPSEIAERVRNLPLGLESQRYRSAGQIRDFSPEPRYIGNRRKIGLLVAWNDSTNFDERLTTREMLRRSEETYEVKSRLNARTIHRLMRNSLMVACPPGNGLDTHRFWESLYLGAIPVVLKRHTLPSWELGTYFAVDSWDDVVKMNRRDMLEVYTGKVQDLKKFRSVSQDFLDTIRNS